MLNVFMALPNQEEEAVGGEIQEDDADYEYYYDEGSGEASGEADLESRGYSGLSLGGRGRGLQGLAVRQQWAAQQGGGGGLGGLMLAGRGGRGVAGGLYAPRFSLQQLGRGNRRLGVSGVSGVSGVRNKLMSSSESQEEADYEEYLDDYYTTADAAVDATNSKYEVGLEGSSYSQALALPATNNLDRRISVAASGNRGLGLYGNSHLAQRNGPLAYQGSNEAAGGNFANIGGRRFEGFGGAGYGNNAGFGGALYGNAGYAGVGGGGGGGGGVGVSSPGRYGGGAGGLMGRDYGGGGWGGGFGGGYGGSGYGGGGGYEDQRKYMSERYFQVNP